MKKLLLIIGLLFMSIYGFSQNPTDPINGNLNLRSTPPQQTQSQSSYALEREAAHFRNKGIANVICGGLWAGLGTACLITQPNPYYYYDNSAYFWCGVTLCTIGGIEMICGIVQLGHSGVLLSRSRQITLTPSTRDVGLAIHF